MMRFWWKLPIALACLLAARCTAGQAQPAAPPPAGPVVIPLKQNEPLRTVDTKAYAFYAHGISLARAGEWQLAAEAFREVIELDAKAVDARVNLAKALLHQGKADEALTILERAVEIDATSVRARMALGEALIRKLRPKDGLAQWEAALPHADFLDKQRLLSTLSRAYERAGEMDKAIEYTRQQLKEAPYSALALLRLAGLYRAQGNYKAAIGPLKKLLELRPTELLVLRGLAQVQARARQYDEAAKTYERALEHVALDCERIRIYFSLIRLMRMARQPERAADYRHEAMQLVGAAVGQAVTGEEFLRVRALLPVERDIDKAVELFRDAIDELDAAPVKPEQAAELHHNLAVLLMISRKYVGATSHARKAIERLPDAARSHALLGIVLTRTEHYDQAHKELTRAIELAPRDGCATYRMALGSSLAAAGKTDEAIEQFRQAVRARPDHLQARLKLSTLLEENRQYGPAARHLEAALPLLANDLKLLAQSHHTLGELYRKLGRLDDAIREHRKGIKIAPAEPFGYMRLAWLLGDRRKFDEAITVLDEAIKQAPKQYAGRFRLIQARMHERTGDKKKAETIIRKVINDEPDNAAAYDALAGLLSRSGKYEQAVTAVKQAVAAAKDASVLARCHDTLGELYRKLGRPDDAIREHRKGIKIAPAEPFGYMRLAWLLGDQRKFDEAITVLDEAIKNVSEEHSARCRVMQARMHERAGDKKRAETIIRKIINDEPASALGYDALAGFLSRSGKYEQAVTAVKQAIALADDTQKLRHRLHLASIYQDMDRFEDCGKILQEERRRHPDSAMVNNQLGYFYAERGKNLDEAVRLVKMALEQEPDNGAYLDSLGWAYFKQGKHQQALEQLERAAVEEPDPVIVDHLGDALHALGRSAEARQKWQQALDLDPDDKLAQAVRKKLKQHQAPDNKEP